MTNHFFWLCALVVSLAACSPPPDPASDAVPRARVTEAPASPKPHAFEIIARGLSFEAPATTPAGWTTIRLRNEAPMAHFALVQRLPEGADLSAHQQQVAPVFQKGMDLLNLGEHEAALQAFGDLPAWFHDIVFLGGPGLVSGGEVAETTLLLEPGTYLIECYVKTGGRFHSYNPAPTANGMVAQFEVTAPGAATGPPTPAMSIELSGAHGIAVRGNLRAGPQIVQVDFLDQTAHENFVGHDLHLAKITAETDLDALLAWMDWRTPSGLETPAPARFIAGTNEMPAGARAYLHLDLEPGRYAWISEVPDAASKGLLFEFSLP